mmetsp:Transcript_40132/g.78417  ORF Transcript_40132/g.78417 Transcript_40132/m.78417 type:complete len:126 (+) Transcript_40132:243-620(+)
MKEVFYREIVWGKLNKTFVNSVFNCKDPDLSDFEVPPPEPFFLIMDVKEHKVACSNLVPEKGKYPPISGGLPPSFKLKPSVSAETRMNTSIADYFEYSVKEKKSRNIPTGMAPEGGTNITKLTFK